MLDYIEALAALADSGTMGLAAKRLHLTQSAVSKRIAALEAAVGLELIQRSGRNVQLTPQGIVLLERARPVVSELREILAEQISDVTGHFNIIVAESILLSWGARMLAKLKRLHPQVNFNVHTYRGSMALERVRTGEFMLSLSPGEPDRDRELHGELIFEEEMVIIPSALEPFRFPKHGLLPVITTDRYSTTWTALEPRVKDLSKKWGFHITVEKQVESFSGVVRMAEAGFGHGLAPRGVAKALGLAAEHILSLPKPGLFRPIALFGKHSAFARPLVLGLLDSLKKNIATR